MVLHWTIELVGVFLLGSFAHQKRWLSMGVFSLMLLGGLSNGIIMSVNHNKMPVSLEAWDRYPPKVPLNEDYKHSIMTPDSKLKPLADIYPIKYIGVASVGDFLCLGLLPLLWIVGGIETKRAK